MRNLSLTCLVIAQSSFKWKILLIKSQRHDCMCGLLLKRLDFASKIKEQKLLHANCISMRFCNSVKNIQLKNPINVASIHHHTLASHFCPRHILCGASAFHHFCIPLSEWCEVMLLKPLIIEMSCKVLNWAALWRK